MPTVVVTRPQPDAALWVQQLQDAGLQACALPMMVIGPSSSPAAIASLQQTLPQLARYRALMFVSGNAVRYFFAALQAQAITPPVQTQYWSPGPGTSKALLSEGISAQSLIQPAPDAPQFDSEALWAQARHHIQPGDRVLIVRGGDGSQPGGQGRPPHPPVEMHDKDVVQHHVHQAAGDDADDADMGRAVGLDLDLQVVGHGEKNGEAGDDPHVLLYQVVVFPGGPQEVRHPVQVEQDQHRQEQEQKDFQRFAHGEFPFRRFGTSRREPYRVRVCCALRGRERMTLLYHHPAALAKGRKKPPPEGGGFHAS